MAQVSNAKPLGGRVWPMYRAMVGVGLLCGVLIVGFYELTKPVIARNRAAALEAAIFEVVPGTGRQTFVLDAEGRYVPAENGGDEKAERIHAVYDAAGELVGVAIEAAGMGYQDTISIIYGVDIARQVIVGMAVLDSRETPGLGDKIEKEPHFLASFEALDVSLDASGEAIAHPIEVVAQGQRVEPWQIDGITGATISSQAIGSILRESTAEWMPRLGAEGTLALTPQPPADTPDATGVTP